MNQHAQPTKSGPALRSEQDSPSVSRWLSGAIVLACFTLAIVAPILLKASAWYKAQAVDWPRDVRWLVQPTIWLLIIAGGYPLVQRLSARPGIRPTLGLCVAPARIARGVGLGICCSLPMLALGLMTPTRELTRDVVYTTALAGLSEELLFRAFAFGLLVQCARVRLWPAAILTGIVFGLIHLVVASVQAKPLGDQIGWIGFIALGGVLYAWIYAKSGWNLWLVIALHAAMNFWWAFFDLNANPVGVTGATMARVLCVVLAMGAAQRLGRVPRAPGSTIP